MAILITDNDLIDRPPLDMLIEGAAAQHMRRLLTPQLQPAMTYTNGSTINLRIDLASADRPNSWCLAILGATADGGPLELDALMRPGSPFPVPVSIEQHVLQAPGGLWHTVVCPTVSVSINSQWLGLQWTAYQGQIGSLYLGTRHDVYALADAGWSIRYPDQRQRATSYGGQVYSASDDPLIAREASIPAAYGSTEQGGIGGMMSVPDIAGIYHRHGHTRPIIAMTHPHDDDMNLVTGMYGTMEGGSAISHTSGPLFGSALRLRETL